MDSPLHCALAPAGERVPARLQAPLRGGPAPPGQAQPQVRAEG